MKIETELKLDFGNVLIRPKRSTISSRSEVSLTRHINKFPHSPEFWEGVPVMAANMDTIGTFAVYDTLVKHKIITCFHKFYTVEDFIAEEERRAEIKDWLDENYFAISTGISEADLEKMTAFKKNADIFCFKWLCIDVANGYMEKLVTFCRKMREMFPHAIIIAGNVVSREMTEELIINGMVDIVKVGIGGGSACLTRQKTGVGMPQLSAIIECADAAHGVNGFIIGDGGITCPGDMSKAFGGGADFVMVGGQFSGHDENPGEVIEEADGKKYKMFYGMSSDHAMKKHYGKMAEYRSSEGRTIKVPYRGSLNDTVLDYLGGVRSTCAYINAHKIKDMPKCTTFVVVSQQLNNFFGGK
jgi:GMP reductase